MRAYQHGFACSIETMNSKDVLCQINSNRYDSLGRPLHE